MQIPENAILLLRLEGPLQAWGTGSHWTVRETGAEPSKSGVIGLLCCALGWARDKSLDDFRDLRMGVRVDRPGEILCDYHTVGAGYGVMSADGKIKKTATTGEYETVLSPRWYLCDARFLVALSGPRLLLTRLRDALLNPVWPIFLGRKSCPPSAPVLNPKDANLSQPGDLLSVLSSQPWCPRLLEVDPVPSELRYVVEASPGDPGAYSRKDVPVSFRPLRHDDRHVREVRLPVSAVAEPIQQPCPRATRERMRYNSRAWKGKDGKRDKRSQHDNFLCAFCGLPSNVVHHITYERANHEDIERDLRSLCRLCHDAVTMLESERDMGKERIDPCSEKWRGLILAKRTDICRSRQPRHSIHGRR